MTVDLSRHHPAVDDFPLVIVGGDVLLSPLHSFGKGEKGVFGRVEKRVPVRLFRRQGCLYCPPVAALCGRKRGGAGGIGIFSVMC